jgi:hypothetical protein
VGGTNHGELLRNSSLEELAGIAVNQFKAKGLCALSQSPDRGDAPLLVVRGSALVGVDNLALEASVDQDGELACGGRDGFGFSDAEREPAEEGAESRLRATEALRSEAQGESCTVR